eukprot:evm.model.NODE_46852_length_22811_cov_31.356846.4
MTAAEWGKVCDGMNTSEITRGSLWLQEESNPSSSSSSISILIEKYLCRWQGMSYLHVSWETPSDLMHCVGPSAKASIRRFLNREREGKVEVYNQYDPEEFFDPQWREIDRVLNYEEEGGEEEEEGEGEEEEGGEKRKKSSSISPSGTGSRSSRSSSSSSNNSSARYLIKWSGLPYAEATWEKACDLALYPDLPRHLAAFQARQIPPRHGRKGGRKGQQQQQEEEERRVFMKEDYEAQPAFKGGGQLREYQWEAVKWMVFNWAKGSGSILADEMVATLPSYSPPSPPHIHNPKLSFKNFAVSPNAISASGNKS